MNAIEGCLLGLGRSIPARAPGREQPLSLGARPLTAEADELLRKAVC
jgi:hypothetical protein